MSLSMSDGWALILALNVLGVLMAARVIYYAEEVLPIFYVLAAVYVAVAAIAVAKVVRHRGKATA